jgi:LysR family transcriptional regulator, glycine cleavage system transcriptional activator
MRSTSLHAIDAAASEQVQRRSGERSFRAVTNSRLLPPMPLLRAFVVTAQTCSMARAADALRLTPSAVSKQIAELERWLGVALFARVRKRLALTSQGERYRAALMPALMQIEAATADAVGNDGRSEVVRLGVLPTVQHKWLLPRLPQFHALHPHIDLRVGTYSQVDDTPPHAEFDAVIRFGAADDAAWLSDYLVGREIVLIAPPHAAQTQCLRAPHDVHRFQLIHHMLWPDSWAQWSAMHRVRGLDTSTGARLMLASSMINAVSTSESVALMPLFFVHDDIAQGVVTAPFPPYRYEEGGYFLCFPAAATSRTAVMVLREWLLGAAGNTPRTLVGRAGIEPATKGL